MPVRLNKTLVILSLSLAGVLAARPASAAPIVFGSNAYEYVSGFLSWDQANSTAQSMTYNGVSGHLVTITSAAENTFVTSLIASVQHSVWIGANDRAVEGEWRWVTGEQFWTGGGAGSVGPDVLYANWGLGQPDNFGSGQDVATIFGGLVVAPGVAGRWDDGGDGIDSGGSIFQRDGFLVEFERAAVPEPGTLLLLGIGLGAVARRVRKAAD
jgi:hypothetical protein